VLHFLKKHHYTFCVVIYKAQNHSYHAMIINGWVWYIKQQIDASAYMTEQICNFDETNIDFDQIPGSTLSKIGRGWYLFS
jgi:hypothetical protein